MVEPRMIALRNGRFYPAALVADDRCLGFDLQRHLQAGPEPITPDPSLENPDCLENYQPNNKAEQY